MNTTVLMDAIQNKNASVGIIGLGYVGLPLAMNFCKSGFSVLGFDVDDYLHAFPCILSSYISWEDG